MADVPENRKDGRVEFGHAVAVRIVAIDGTWQRDCSMLDVAPNGAKLVFEQPIAGLNLKEFFLVLSSTGLAFRRCELAWINGNQIGVRFLDNQKPKKKPAPPRR